MKSKKPVSAVWAVLTTTALLTSCASAPSAAPASSRIYQPRVLELPAGQPVQTREGIYVPQTNETWHSAAAYEQAGREAMNAAAVAAQERARR